MPNSKLLGIALCVCAHDNWKSWCATWDYNYDYYYYTCSVALYPGLPSWASTRMVNHSGFTGARDSEWQWHQLGHMQTCISPHTYNHASTPPLRFLPAGCPSCCPTNSIEALKTINVTHFIYSWLLGIPGNLTARCRIPEFATRPLLQKLCRQVFS